MKEGERIERSGEQQLVPEECTGNLHGVCVYRRRGGRSSCAWSECEFVIIILQMGIIVRGD